MKSRQVNKIWKIYSMIINEQQQINENENENLILKMIKSSREKIEKSSYY